LSSSWIGCRGSLVGETQGSKQTQTVLEIKGALEQALGADRAVHPGADHEDSGVVTCHSALANNWSV
jgi:hypothetical protein